MLVFFLTSSLLSCFRPERRLQIEQAFAKGTTRDGVQVAANGGIGGVLVLCWWVNQDPVWFVAYLSAVAAAAADTWGTELGILSHRRPVIIPSMKPATTGMSGAVSAEGSLAALGGAIMVAISGIAWISVGDLPIAGAIVVGAGIIGAFIDSILGGTVQVQYRCVVCDKVTERANHCGTAAVAARGHAWFDNDIVNCLCTLGASTFGGVTFYVLRDLR